LAIVIPLFGLHSSSFLDDLLIEQMVLISLPVGPAPLSEIVPIQNHLRQDFDDILLHYLLSARLLLPAF